MKKLLSFFLFVLFGLTASSQYMKTKMKISPTEYNFGAFKEEAGRQTFDFIVTNTGDQPLILQNVVASCGCTTPVWTKSPISPGGKGKVTAIYDPVNRPGVFNKTLTVYSNAVPPTIVLTIKGEVTPREKTIEELFTFPVGGIRFESSNLAFSNIKKTEKKSIKMPFINTSTAPVKVEFDVLPAHLTLKLTPEIIQPGQKGTVEGTYDGVKNQEWGNVYDLIKIKINGFIQENVFLYVSANLVEDFSSLSKEDRKNAPIFRLASETYDLGKIKGSTQHEVEFKFTNGGGRDLIIRKIKSTCGCTAVQQENQGIGVKPGASSSIKAVFNSGGYKGEVTKIIYVYTNDPENSEAILTLTADVDQPAPEK